jgi:hypothetical protein
METNPRLKHGCGEASDLIAAGQQLIIAGARSRDGLTIKAGIDKFRQAGWPFQVIVMMARALIRDDRHTSRQTRHLFKPSKLSNSQNSQNSLNP